MGNVNQTDKVINKSNIQFLLLESMRDLENYVSRERYYLSKMVDNENVSYSLLMSKVDHFNQLVNTLNYLFCSLIDTNGVLFHTFDIEHDLDDVDNDNIVDVIENDDLDDDEVEQDDDLDVSDLNDDLLNEQNSDDVIINDSIDGGISDDNSYTIDDGVEDEVSMKHADEMLSDYERTSEQDITTYDPELDKPADVLNRIGYDDGRASDLLSEENTHYLKHTLDNVRVNDDPTQIVDTLTAVEKDQSAGVSKSDTELSNFMSDGEFEIDVNSLIEDDLDKLYTNRNNDIEDESSNYDDNGENNEDVHDEELFNTDGFDTVSDGTEEDSDIDDAEYEEYDDSIDNYLDEEDVEYKDDEYDDEE